MLKNYLRVHSYFSTQSIKIVMETHKEFFIQSIQFIITADENLAQQFISPRW